MQGKEHLEKTQPQLAGYVQTWKTHFPDWSLTIWDEAQGLEALEQVQPNALANYKKLKSFAAKSDVCRYAILYLNGGMYVDTDMECLRPFAHDLPSEDDVFDMVISLNTSMTKAERSFLSPVNNCWFIARKGAATLKHVLDNFVKWNGVHTDVLVTTVTTTGPVAFEKSLRSSGDVVYEIPSRLIEIVFPLNKCIMAMDTQSLRRRFPHSYAVHHMSGSWVKKKPSCFFFKSWFLWRDNVDVISFTFGFIIVILLVLVIVFGIRSCNQPSREH